MLTALRVFFFSKRRILWVSRYIFLSPLPEQGAQKKGAQSVSAPACCPADSVLCLKSVHTLKPRVSAGNSTARQAERNTHKRLKYSTSEYISFGTIFFWIPGNTDTKGKAHRGLCEKLARIWEMRDWSCHSCVSDAGSDLFVFSPCLFSPSVELLCCADRELIYLPHLSPRCARSGVLPWNACSVCSWLHPPIERPCW